MDIAVPSRFACLKIEDDEFRPVANKNKKKPVEKVAPAKKASIATNQAPQQKKGISSSNNAKQQPSSKKKDRKGRGDEKQWEEWKRKDDELVNDNFEEDLKCAILQSKLDFEKQKKNVINTKRPEPTEQSSSGKKSKKGKTTMSLDQFLDNGTAEAEPNKVEKGEEIDSNFFDEVLETAKTEITREKVEESRRKRNENMEKIITLAQCQEKLEKERIKNSKLHDELKEARKEISLVKKRNTTLCNMLSQGEMKDKAEVLLELERLRADKEELTEEVSKLHKLLEQERSNKSNGVITESHAKQHHKDKLNKKKKN